MSLEARKIQVTRGLQSGMVVHTWLSPAFRRKRQVDLWEYEASLVYKVSSRTARVVTQRNSVSKKQKTKRTEVCSQ